MYELTTTKHEQVGMLGSWPTAPILVPTSDASVYDSLITTPGSALTTVAATSLVLTAAWARSRRRSLRSSGTAAPTMSAAVAAQHHPTIPRRSGRWRWVQSTATRIGAGARAQRAGRNTRM